MDKSKAPGGEAAAFRANGASGRARSGAEVSRHRRPVAGTRLDVGSPNVARMYDYFLGGKDHFQVDRDCADAVLSRVPLAREMARANRAFLARAVRFLAGELGIAQFLDIGVGLPTRENIHQMAQRINPDSRVVYVDNDPVVLVHARALLARDAQTRVIRGDLPMPEGILEHPDLRGLLDLSQPVAVLLAAVLHFVPDGEAQAAVRTLVDAIAPGSCVLVTHVERRAELEEGARQYQRANLPVVLRPVKDIEEFLDGLDLVSPGLVRLRRWRPDESVLALDEDVPVYGGVAIKR